eukprot:bmy_13898T0
MTQRGWWRKATSTALCPWPTRGACLLESTASPSSSCFLPQLPRPLRALLGRLCTRYGPPSTHHVFPRITSAAACSTS